MTQTRTFLAAPELQGWVHHENKRPAHTQALGSQPPMPGASGWPQSPSRCPREPRWPGAEVGHTLPLRSHSQPSSQAERVSKAILPTQLCPNCVLSRGLPIDWAGESGPGDNDDAHTVAASAASVSTRLNRPVAGPGHPHCHLSHFWKIQYA